ncbi:hypothetical protein ABEF93_006947 [Exophiala dermatitidis]
MAPWLRLAALPASVLALIVATATTTAAQHNPDWDWQWLYNLPPDAKYYPEDEVVIKRDIAIQQKLQRSGATVTGVRKMSGDPGEKFYLDYWGFAPETEEEEYDEVINRANNATLALLDAAVRVKRDAPRAKLHLPGWHLFQKRGFQCPSGTTACTSIDRPNSCCATDSTYIDGDAGEHAHANRNTVTVSNSDTDTAAFHHDRHFVHDHHAKSITNNSIRIVEFFVDQYLDLHLDTNNDSYA